MTINIDMVTPTTPVTFNEYYELLVNADWFHGYSDSSKVSWLGASREGILAGIANRHSFANYMFQHFVDVRNASIVGSKESTVRTLANLKASYKESK